MSTGALTATLQLDHAKNLSVPKGIPADKLLKLNEAIVEKVIKVHTGCSCLSGTINVLLESNWEAPMQVNL